MVSLTSIHIIHYSPSNPPTPAVYPTHLSPLTPPQPHRLPILLQLRDQLITLLDHIIILLTLIIRPIRLDHSLTRHAVDRTRDAIRRDELRQVTISKIR